MQKRAKQQQIGPIHVAREGARLNGGFDEMTIDRESMQGIALRSRAHDVPPGDQSADDPGLIQCLPHRHKSGPSTKKCDERLTILCGPVDRRTLGNKPIHRVG